LPWEKRQCQFDDFPHPDDPALTSNLPQHKHLPPDIRHPNGCLLARHLMTRLAVPFHKGCQVAPSSAEYSTTNVFVCPSEEMVSTDFVL
jgi:hypothetical protein